MSVYIYQVQQTAANSKRITVNPKDLNVPISICQNTIINEPFHEVHERLPKTRLSFPLVQLERLAQTGDVQRMTNRALDIVGN